MNKPEPRTLNQKYVLVYITAANFEEAKTIVKNLIEKRLVACCNIVPQIESVYWWKGKIFEEKETLIFAKTTRDQASEVISQTKSLHSYEVPDVTVIEIAQGYPPYLKWIGEETKPER